MIVPPHTAVLSLLLSLALGAVRPLAGADVGVRSDSAQPVTAYSPQSQPQQLLYALSAAAGEGVKGRPGPSTKLVPFTTANSPTFTPPSESWTVLIDCKAVKEAQASNSVDLAARIRNTGASHVRLGLSSCPLSDAEMADLNSALAHLGSLASASVPIARGLHRRNLGTTDDMHVTNVAYVVLYIITAVVCLLFVVIIGTGAWRAARHPERYGRRVLQNGPGGQQRQQGVVKGLSQAVLDSFPVISFPTARRAPERDLEAGGPLEHRKQVQLEMDNLDGPREGKLPADVETLEDTPRSLAVAEDGERDVTEQAAERAATPARLPPSSTPPPAAVAAAATLISDDFEDSSNATTCPICVEDFEPGDQLRVLPCDGRHRFHAQCVDPYLLKHSSLCPLCRKDLKGHAAQPAVVEARRDSQEAEEDTSRRSRTLSGLMNAMTARRRTDADGGDGRAPRTRSESRAGRPSATPTPVQAV